MGLKERSRALRELDAWRFGSSQPKIPWAATTSRCSRRLIQAGTVSDGFVWALQARTRSQANATQPPRPCLVAEGSAVPTAATIALQRLTHPGLLPARVTPSHRGMPRVMRGCGAPPRFTTRSFRSPRLGPTGLGPSGLGPQAGFRVGAARGVAPLPERGRIHG